MRRAPEDPHARLALGNTYLALARLPEAEAEFRHLTERSPRSAPGWAGLATALYHQGRFFEATQAAWKAVRLDRREPNYRYILATASLEFARQFPDPLVRPQSLRVAQIQLMNLLGVWPDKGDLYYRLGLTMMASRDGKSAVRYLRRARELMPGRVDIWRQLVRAHMRLGERDAALAAAEEGLRNHPRDPALNDLLGQLVQTRPEPDANERALRAFRTAVEQEPDNPVFHQRLGMALLRANRLEEARRSFETSVRLNPNRPFPHQQLAAIYTRLGETERASAAARMAMQMSANDEQIRRLEALLKRFPDDPELNLALGDGYRHVGNRGAARDQYLIVLRLDPRNSRARQALAELERESAPRPAARP